MPNWALNPVGWIEAHGLVTHLVHYIRLTGRLCVLLRHLLPGFAWANPLHQGSTMVGNNLTTGLILLLRGILLTPFSAVLSVFRPRGLLRVLDAVNL